MINIARARQIDGWMTNAELLWLGEQASSKNLVVEIGSYKGRSTRVLGDYVLGILYAVDTWVGPISITTPKVDCFENEFRSNLLDLIEAKKVIPVTPENELLRTLKPDMVFIDGNHEFEAAVKDITTWKPRVISGGLLCGHDVSSEGVERALNELKINIATVENTSIWYIHI